MNTKHAAWPLPSLVDGAQCTTTVRSLCHVIHGHGKVVGNGFVLSRISLWPEGVYSLD